MKDREERRERGKKIFQRVTAAGLVAAALRTDAQRGREEAEKEAVTGFLKISSSAPDLPFTLLSVHNS